MKQKPVCQLDPEGFFVGMTMADESPLEPGVFLIPGGAIDAPEPEIPPGQRAKWEDGWVYSDIPDPGMPQRMLTPDDVEINIKNIRTQKSEVGGFPVALGGAVYWFHSDTFSRSQLLGLVAQGDTLPAGIKWKTMSGEFVEMTPEIALAVLRSATAQDLAIFAAAERHIATMRASADHMAYDYQNTGWPTVYGESGPDFPLSDLA